MAHEWSQPNDTLAHDLVVTLPLIHTNSTDAGTILVAKAQSSRRDKRTSSTKRVEVIGPDDVSIRYRAQYELQLVQDEGGHECEYS